MIVFDLQCACGYQFEGWFESSAEYEKQNCHCLLTCPQCGNNKIHKILSPVAFHSDTSQKNITASLENNVDSTADAVIRFLDSVQDYVEKNFDDVGSKLATETLKMHFGVVEPRNIRGVATDDEEKMLSDEGIKLLKIPMIKKRSDSKLN